MKKLFLVVSLLFLAGCSLNLPPVQYYEPGRSIPQDFTITIGEWRDDFISDRAPEPNEQYFRSRYRGNSQLFPVLIVRNRYPICRLPTEGLYEGFVLCVRTFPDTIDRPDELMKCSLTHTPDDSFYRVGRANPYLPRYMYTCDFIIRTYPYGWR